jgi:hypothetical protein
MPRSSNEDPSGLGTLLLIVWTCLYYFAVYPVLTFIWPSGNTDNIYYIFVVITLIIGTPFIFAGLGISLFFILRGLGRLGCNIFTTISTLHLRWTIVAPPIGWRSLHIDSEDESIPLLPGALEARTAENRTSKLCKHCSSLVCSSSLLSGSYWPFVYQDSWYSWTPAARNTHLDDPRASCHLCAILWPIVHNGTRVPDMIAPEIWVQMRRSHSTSHLTLRLWQNRLASNPQEAISSKIIISKGRRYHGSTYTMLMNTEKLGNESASVRISCWSGSGTNAELLKTWVATCHSKHHDTCHATQKRQENSYLPPRLLYVGDELSSVLQVINTSETLSSTQAQRYIALCSRPGQHEPIDISRSSDDSPDESRLPKLFRHAVLLTRQLGLQYLWIDELCTSDDYLNSSQRASMTGKAYTYAYCTVFAHGSVDGDERLFQNRSSSLTDFPCRLRFSKTEALTIRATKGTFNARSFSTEIDKSLLSQDPWGLHARLLSKCSLHFGATFLFFECSTHICSEATPLGILFQKRGKTSLSVLQAGSHESQLDPGALPTEFNPVNGLQADFDALCRQNDMDPENGEKYNLHLAWGRIVTKVTGLEGSTSDKVDSAIQGLALAISDKSSDTVYLHGLWKRHLLYDLLWFVKSNTPNKRKRLTPSWSWQGIGESIFTQLHTESKVSPNLRSYITEIAEAYPEGISDSASSRNRTCVAIQLKCPLYRVLRCTLLENCSWELDLDSKMDIEIMRLRSDRSDLDSEQDMFFAELVLETLHLAGGKRSIGTLDTAWSHGIILKRKVLPCSSGVDVEYRRVGRGWLRWRNPLSHILVERRKQAVKLW